MAHGCWDSLSSRPCATTSRRALEDTRRTLCDRNRVERGNVERIEQMVAAPERFKWVRISNEDIGEPACKHWHSRPRFGLIGMLMGWWRVKISSGCP